VGGNGGRLCLQNLVSFHWVDNVVDFVLKALSQSSRHWGTWVTNLVDKLSNLVDKTLSLTVSTTLNGMIENLN
jgi:hypothetical protein